MLKHKNRASLKRKPFERLLMLITKSRPWELINGRAAARKHIV